MIPTRLQIMLRLLVLLVVGATTVIADYQVQQCVVKKMPVSVLNLPRALIPQEYNIVPLDAEKVVVW